ncbi:MAG: ribose 5-phosphate isomerase B [Candidatus Omnitrophica bacterium]|nr:ribose 5-phosphate isomerase B [Candidatus Omnitrophota bacterium]
MSCRIALGADHGGFKLKAVLVDYLRKQENKVEDLGTYSEESCDYPEYGYKVASAVAEGRADRGVLVCRSGVGIAIVANRVPGVRAGVCHDAASAAHSRQHNDTNVLVLGADHTPAEQAVEILDAWLRTEFEGGRHARRLAMIEEIEKRIHLSS